MTRRGVFTGVAAVAGMTALPRFLSARSTIGHVVVDERLPQSAHFAAGVGAPRRHAVSALDDLCNRWYTGMRAAVLLDSGHVAGLTTWMDYVVMRSCAAEIGYRRAFHAEHRPVGTTALAHTVSAHPDLLPLLAGLREPQRWPAVIGQSLASGDHLRSRFEPGQVFRATTAAAPGQSYLVTWVFSPA